MIKAISKTTDVPDVEMMNVIGKIDPLDTDQICVTIDYDDLTVLEQADYDAAVAVLNNVYQNTIINTDADLTIDRVTSATLLVTPEELDWDVMSEPDKDKLRALLAIIVAKAV